MGFSKYYSVRPFGFLVAFFLFTLIAVFILLTEEFEFFKIQKNGNPIITAQLYGATVEDTELSLTNVLENAFSGLTGVRSINSKTSAGHVAIWLEVDDGVDLQYLRFEIGTILRLIQSKLPRHATYPVVSLSSKGSVSSDLSLSFAIAGNLESDDIRSFFEEQIKPALARIDGVDFVEISGLRSKKIVLNTHTSKLKSVNLSFEELFNILKRNMDSFHLGVVRTAESSFECDLLGVQRDSFKKFIDDFYIKSVDGRIFYFSDLIEIQETYVDLPVYQRLNGSDLVEIEIGLTRDAGAAKAIKNVQAYFADLEKSATNGIEFLLTSHPLKQSVLALERGLISFIISTFLFLLLCYFYVKSARFLGFMLFSITVIVLLFVAIYLVFRLELNQHALVGLYVVIVVLLFQILLKTRASKNYIKIELSVIELRYHLIGLAGFSLVLLNESISRDRVVIDLLRAICITQCISLAVLYFFIPSLLIQFPVRCTKGSMLRVRRKGEIWPDVNFLVFLHYLERYRWKLLLIFFFAFFLCHSWYFKNESKFEKIQSENRPHSTQLLVNLKMPSGSSVAQMNTVVRQVEAYLARFELQLDHFISYVKAQEAELIISFKPLYEKKFPHLLKEGLRSYIWKIGSVDAELYGVGREFGNSIELDRFNSSIQLSGYHFPLLRELASQVSDSLQSVSRVSHVFISSEERVHKLNDAFHFNWMSQMPISQTAKIKGMASHSLLQGQQREELIGFNQILAESVPIYLSNAIRETPSIWSVLNTPLHVGDSLQIRLGSGLGSLDRVRLGETIFRKDRQYVLNIHYQFLGSPALNSFTQERVVESFSKQLPLGYKIIGTDQVHQNSQRKDAAGLFVIGLILCVNFILGAICTESLLEPLIGVILLANSFLGFYLSFLWFEIPFERGGVVTMLLLLFVVYFMLVTSVFGTGGSKQWKFKPSKFLIGTGLRCLIFVPFFSIDSMHDFWFNVAIGSLSGLLFSLVGVVLVFPILLMGDREDRIQILKRLR